MTAETVVDPAEAGAPGSGAEVRPRPATDQVSPPGGETEPEAASMPSLSPSRAADFKTCPLLFRFRTIDRLPEVPSADQARGTLVHAVLEKLFDLEPAARTPRAAAELVAPQWRRLVAEQPPLAALFSAADPPAGQGTAAGHGLSTGTGPDAAQDTDAARRPSHEVGQPTPATGGPDPDDRPVVPSQGAARPAGSPAGTDARAEPVAPDGSPSRTDAPAEPVAEPADGESSGAGQVAEFLASARALLAGYFSVEDPRRLEPAERESLVSAVIDDQLLIRGYVDRLDVAPSGDLRVVDYKTGGAPREAFEARALFQLKFYALVLWRTRGVVPRVLRLLYLKDAEVCDYAPEAEELVRFERTLLALWKAIERATAERDFRPKPSRLCDWCGHRALCPTYGGTPPPYPDAPAAGSSGRTARERAAAARPVSGGGEAS